MDAFTYVDGIVAAVIVISAILAFSRGLLRELLSIGGWIAAAVVAFLLAPLVEPLMREIPVVGEFLADSCELSIIGAFAVAFTLALLVISLFTPLFASAVKGSALSGLDQGLGFLFGVARGILLVVVAFIVYDRVAFDTSVEAVDNSRSAKVFASLQGNIDEQIPEDAPGWILQRYEELVAVCDR